MSNQPAARHRGARVCAGILAVACATACGGNARGGSPRLIAAPVGKRSTAPSKPVDVNKDKDFDTLLSAMASQEVAYRAARAEWEDKINALSRQNDQYKTEVTTMGSIIDKLKFWLWLGAIALGVACIFIPGLWIFLVKFVAGRAKAHLVSTVEAIQDFRENNRDIAPKLDAALDKYQDKATKANVIDIKTKIKKRKIA